MEVEGKAVEAARSYSLPEYIITHNVKNGAKKIIKDSDLACS